MTHVKEALLRVGNTAVLVDTDSMDVIQVLPVDKLAPELQSSLIPVEQSNITPALRDLALSASDLSVLTASALSEPQLVTDNRTYRIPASLNSLFTLAVQNAALSDPDFKVPPIVDKILHNSALSHAELTELSSTNDQFWEEYSGEALRSWTHSLTASAALSESMLYADDYTPVPMPVSPTDAVEAAKAEAADREKSTLQQYLTLDPEPQTLIERAEYIAEEIQRAAPSRAAKYKARLQSIKLDIEKLKNLGEEEIQEVITGASTVLATGQGPTTTDTVNRHKVKARLPSQLLLISDPASLITNKKSTVTGGATEPGSQENKNNGSSGTSPDNTPEQSKEVRPSSRETPGQPSPDAVEPSGEAQFLPTGETNTGLSSTPAIATPDNTTDRSRIHYLAVVDRADTQSVLDLLALVKQSINDGDVKVFVRKGRAWVVSDHYLLALRSTAPPPVVKIVDDSWVADLKRQIDAWEAEQPRTAEKGTPLRADGTQLKPVNRSPSSSKVAQQLASNTGQPATPATPATPKSSAPSTTSVPTPGSFVKKSENNSTELPTAGKTTFSIPMVLPENVSSGDGRKFTTGALSARDLPITLSWQQQGFDGHSGSVIVGRIDKLDYEKGKGLVNATGVFDDGPFAQEAIRLIKDKMLRGISADLDNFEASLANKDSTNKENSVSSPKMDISSARLMGVTLVAKPAFQECVITIKEEPVQDGVYVEKVPKSLMASAAPPVDPPTAWFENPSLIEPTPLTISDDGRVFGHIALWDTDHIGMPNGTKPPKSKAEYAYFHTGIVKTAEGENLPVGQLTLAGGHAPLEATAAAAVRHYDDTASAVADVKAGEDDHGVWVSGALRPGVTELQMRTLRASSPSGDWRPIKGSLELVAVCQVNVPGFPITRARVASGFVTALVAAGASSLALLRMERAKTIENRLELLESGMSSVLRASANFRIDTKTPEGLVAAAALQRARIDFSKSKFS